MSIAKVGHNREMMVEMTSLQVEAAFTASELERGHLKVNYRVLTKVFLLLTICTMSKMYIAINIIQII